MREPKREVVTDEKEIEAIRRGEIDGEVYSDGEAWAERAALRKYREEHKPK